MYYKPVMNLEETEAYVREVFYEATGYNWQIESLSDGQIIVSFITAKEHLRSGGTVSGPTIFALADIAAYFLVLAHVGKVALAVTTNLNINFLRKPEPGKLWAKARLIKLGKRLAVSDIEVFHCNNNNIEKALASPIVAHASATYAIPLNPPN